MSSERYMNKFLPPIIFGSIALVVIMLVTSERAFNAKCEFKWEQSGYEYRAENGVCFVRVNGRWIPENNVRIYTR